VVEEGGGEHGESIAVGRGGVEREEERKPERENKDYTEVTESTEKWKSRDNAEAHRKRREARALDRKSPPSAQNAKDGAPSSSSMCNLRGEIQELGGDGIGFVGVDVEFLDGVLDGGFADEAVLG
jgi:hypothetical protein